MDATIRVCTGGRGRVRPRGAPAAVETTHGKPRQRRRTGSGQIQQRRARLARAGRTRRAVPDQGVRLVSIHDKIDTLGELFPDTTAAQVLEMFGALPEEVAVLRKSSSHIMQLQQTIKPPVTKKAMSRAEREKTIVDMYNNGYSIDDIWEVSGFNSKSSIWRILNKYGVYLNRGRTSGPRVKKQQDETK